MMRRHQWVIGVASVVVVGIGAYAVQSTIAPHKQDSPAPAHTVATGHTERFHLDRSVWPIPVSQTQNHNPQTLQPQPVQKPVKVKLPPGVYYENEVVIVTYHDISPAHRSEWTITPDLFSAQLDQLQQKHFHVISNAQFVRFVNHTGTVPPNAVLMTFDDGYQDMYTYALPILQQHRMTGIFFTIVGKSDELEQHPADPNGPPAAYITWAQLAALQQAGNAIQSHTYNSHYMVTVNGKTLPVFDTPMMVNGVLETQEQYTARVEKDFSLAKQELEAHFGAPVNEFAWPFGYGAVDSFHIAEKVGYQFIFSTNPGVVTTSTWRYDLPRIDIGKPSVTPAGAVSMILQTATGTTTFKS